MAKNILLLTIIILIIIFIYNKYNYKSNSINNEIEPNKIQYDKKIIEITKIDNLLKDTIKLDNEIDNAIKKYNIQQQTIKIYSERLNLDNLLLNLSDNINDDKKQQLLKLNSSYHSYLFLQDKINDQINKTQSESNFENKKKIKY